MEGYYTGYSCKYCKKETILITEEVKKTLSYRKYISCSHCGCKNLILGKVTDDLRECIGHSSYKREHGALRQVRR